jgi:hypothetical protein
MIGKKFLMPEKIYNKQEIIFFLNEKSNAFTDYILALNKDWFEATPDGKWSAGQNLDHLIRSIRPLQLACSLPKFILLILFGKANRPSKNYDELVEKYKAKLAAGGRAGGPFIPPDISFEKKSGLIKKYENQKKKLVAKIEAQNEEDLDRYILPHPLLGKLTLREMLFFTVYHIEHHLSLLKNRLQVQSTPGRTH